MRYYYKPTNSEEWLPIETHSLPTEVSRGGLKWDWQIKWPDGTHKMTVGEMIGGNTVGTVDEPSEKTKSRNPPANALCYLLISDQQTGPYTPSQIRSMWSGGQITADTLYWFEGLAEWFPVSDFCQRSASSSGGASDAVAGSTIACSYALAFLLPLFGFFAGIYLVLKKEAGHGVACMALSVFLPFIYFSLFFHH